MLPWADFRDDLVTVHNIRNSLYRTVDDYTVRLYTKTFDLRNLTSVDLIVVPFNDNPKIAHVLLSFGFQDQRLPGQLGGNPQACRTRLRRGPASSTSIR